MDQTAILAVSIPFALASYVALLPAVNFASRLTDRAATREERARTKLVETALEHLRDLRVQLDKLFEQYDAGKDPFLLNAQPSAVFQPVSEYVRLMKLQTAVHRALVRAQRLARTSFWFLLTFSALITASFVTALLQKAIGLCWAQGTLTAAAVVFIAGGALFILVLLALRTIDAGHVVAGRIDEPEIGAMGE